MFLSYLSSLNYRKVVCGLGRIEPFLSFRVSRLCLVARPRLRGILPITPTTNFEFYSYIPYIYTRKNHK
jgi:hypothetical protein